MTEEMTPKQMELESENLLKFIDALCLLEEVANSWLGEKTSNAAGYVADQILMFTESEIENKTETGILLKKIQEMIKDVGCNCENCKDYVGGEC